MQPLLTYVPLVPHISAVLTLCSSNPQACSCLRAFSLAVSSTSGQYHSLNFLIIQVYFSQTCVQMLAKPNSQWHFIYLMYHEIQRMKVQSLCSGVMISLKIQALFIFLLHHLWYVDFCPYACCLVITKQLIPPGITSIFQAGRKVDAAFPDFPSNVAFLGTLYPTTLSHSDFVSLLGILLVSLFVGHHLPLL